MPRTVRGALEGLGAIESFGRLGPLVVMGSDDALTVLGPALLQLRLDHARDHIALPMSLPLDASAQRVAALGAERVVYLAGSFTQAWKVGSDGLEGAGGAHGGREQIGIGLSPWLSRRLPPRLGESVADRARRLVEACGAPWIARETLHVSKTWRETGRERLARARIDLQRDDPDAGRILGVYAGGVEGRIAWPRKTFEELVRSLRRAPERPQVVILAEDSDLWRAVRLHEETGKTVPVIGPDLALDGVAAVLSQLDEVIGSDSRLLALARAVDTPTVRLLRTGRAAASSEADTKRARVLVSATPAEVVEATLRSPLADATSKPAKHPPVE